MLRICPPSSPISTRANSFSLVSGYHLREDAVHGVGMDECDFEPIEPPPRYLIDKLRARGVEIAEGAVDVVGRERDVMHAWTAPGEKAPDRRVLTAGHEQLDAAVAHTQRDGIDALALQRVPVLDARTEEPLPGLDCLVEIGDRNPEMMDAADVHAADRTSEAEPAC